MLCPMCEDEFRTEGVKWLGEYTPLSVADMAEEELDGWAAQIAAVITERVGASAESCED